MFSDEKLTSFIQQYQQLSLQKDNNYSFAVIVTKIIYRLYLHYKSFITHNYIIYA